MPTSSEPRRLKFVASCNDEILRENTPEEVEIEYVDISSVNQVSGIAMTEKVPFGKAPSRARRLVQHGDTIISTVRTYLKAVAYINRPAPNLVVSTGFAVLRPKHVVDPRFLAYQLQSERFVGEVVARSTGVSYPAINPSSLVDITVSLPPKGEQVSIADYLDRETERIDWLMDKKQQLITGLKEAWQSALARAVTQGVGVADEYRDAGVSWLRQIPTRWRVERLRFVTDMSGGMTPATGVERYWGGETPWVTPKDMKVDAIEDSVDRVTDAALVETGLSLKVPGQVLVVVRGMILAHTFPVAINTAPVTVNQDMKAISGKRGMSNPYLAWLLRGLAPVALNLVEESAHGTKVFRTDQFRDLLVPIPPLHEQAKIVAYVEQRRACLHKLIEMNQRSIGLLAERRASIVTSAVTGQLRVAV